MQGHATDDASSRSHATTKYTHVPDDIDSTVANSVDHSM